MLKNQKGFTLIELAIVIAILGIIAVVAIPTYVNLTDTARVASLKGACGALKSSVGVYVVQVRQTPTVDQLMLPSYLTKDEEVMYSVALGKTWTLISLDKGLTWYGDTASAGAAPSGTSLGILTAGTDSFGGCNMTGIASPSASTKSY